MYSLINPKKKIIKELIKKKPTTNGAIPAEKESQKKIFLNK
jgi:hypothetical protein